MTLQLLSMSQGHSSLPIQLIAPESWLLGNLNGLFPTRCIIHWSAGCLNQHVCVSNKKLCVIETIYQKPIIGGLLSLVAL